MVFAIYLLVGLVLGAAVGWGITRVLQKKDVEMAAQQVQLAVQQAQHETQRLQTENTLLREQQEQHRTTIDTLRAENTNLQTEVGKAEKEIEMLKEQMNGAEERAQQQLAETEQRYKQQMEEAANRSNEQLEKQIAHLNEQMQNATRRLLDERSGQLSESNEKNLSAIVNPLKETMVALKQEMNNTQRQHGDTTVRLEQSIKDLIQQTQNIGGAADRLAKTLTHDTKIQGDWGEVILGEILQSQGLKEGIHYVAQPVLKDAQGNVLINDETNRRMRPDYILHLDNNEDVVIDAKMSLTAFDNYMNAQTEEDKQIYLAQHLRSIRSHVAELCRADYSSYIENGRKSAGFVFMFVPLENALQLAMSADPTLWREAWNKDKVFIVSEINLYAALKVVAFTWRQIEQNRNQERVFKAAGLLLDRVTIFITAFNKMREQLDKIGKLAEDADRKLQNSSTSVLSSASRLLDMGVQTKKQLPTGDVEMLPPTQNADNNAEEQE